MEIAYIDQCLARMRCEDADLPDLPPVWLVLLFLFFRFGAVQDAHAQGQPEDSGSFAISPSETTHDSSSRLANLEKRLQLLEQHNRDLEKTNAQLQSRIQSLEDGDIVAVAPSTKAAASNAPALKGNSPLYPSSLSLASEPLPPLHVKGRGPSVYTAPSSTWQREYEQAPLEAKIPQAHKIQVSDTTWFDVGIGVRSSYRHEGFDNLNGAYLDNTRFYFNGQIAPHLLIEGNLDSRQGPSRTPTPANITDVHLLDGIVKLEINDYVNVWAGQLLLPIDRDNLAGFFYLNTFEFPFVWDYPSVYQGRDYGAAYWGQQKIGSGLLKWQAGIFFDRYLGTAAPNEPVFAGRVMYDFWDAEPGYYLVNSYFGEKNILAIGISGMFQQDAVLNAPSSAYYGMPLAGFMGVSMLTPETASFGNVEADLLFERKFKELGNGTITFQAEYLDYMFSKDITVNQFGLNAGQAYVMTLLYLFPETIGIGQFQPYVQWQEFEQQYTHLSLEEIQAGLNYVIAKFNGRVSAWYSHGNGVSMGVAYTDAVFVGLQGQWW
ncbi:MAG: bZIP transcription factor [Methylacidiphilaceae bacterium]|nr:bZIP transcription factor [Candidatus Methylacidiphilaceae bacterium]